MPLNPISAGLGGLQVLGGLAQTFFSGKRKAERNLENQIGNSPKYQPNQSIKDYYTKALERFNVSPYSSSLYKNQSNIIGRGTAQGISSLQDRRGGLAGISSLIQGQNDALLKAGVAAETQQNQRFGQLAGATQMKAGEDRAAFNQNELKPFEMKYNLLQQKAAAANATKAAGLQNIFKGLGTAASGFFPNVGGIGGGAGQGTAAEMAAMGWGDNQRRGFNSRGYATGVF